MSQVYSIPDILYEKQKFIMMYINTEFNQLRVQYNHLFDCPEFVSIFEQTRHACLHYPPTFGNQLEYVFDTLIDIRTAFEKRK
jgi:hypothetical protein